MGLGLYKNLHVNVLELVCVVVAGVLFMQRSFCGVAFAMFFMQIGFFESMVCHLFYSCFAAASD